MAAGEHPTNGTTAGSSTFLVREVTFFDTYWYVFRRGWGNIGMYGYERVGISMHEYLLAPRKV